VAKEWYFSQANNTLGDNMSERIEHVPTKMKYWEDQMYEAEFEDRWRAYHEFKKLYEYYKALHERGHEYEPKF